MIDTLPEPWLATNASGRPMSSTTTFTATGERPTETVLTSVSVTAGPGTKELEPLWLALPIANTCTLSPSPAVT